MESTLIHKKIDKTPKKALPFQHNLAIPRPP
jgi:hypothetical protein